MPIDTLISLIIAIILLIFLSLSLVVFKRYVIRRRQTIDIPNLLGGRFRRGYMLGRGMNAATYIVEDTKQSDNTEQSNRALVAKVLLTPSDNPRITDESFRRHLARFQREMNYLMEVQHCLYVVPVVQTYPNAITPFFIMKRCDASLADQLTGGPLSLQEVLDTTADILRGLKAIHARNIIHRDLKPANILRLGDRWVLADFGMSLLGDEKSFITAQESMPGTIPYTAPEVIYTESVTSTADIFSLGVCLKEMLTTHTIRNKIPSTLLLNGTDPKTKEEVKLFDDIVTKMTNLDVRMRPQTVVKVAAQLKVIFDKINNKRFNGHIVNGIDKLDI